jgi:F420-non-reducing hydrogenase large subunit
MARTISKEERLEIEAMARSLVNFAVEALSIFETKLLAVPDIKEEIEGDTYYHRTHYAGLVDEAGRVNFYDGRIRVVNPRGKEVALFEAADYLEHIAERVVPWSYLKIPYLKNVGWRGMTDGEESGVYRVNACTVLKQRFSWRMIRRLPARTSAQFLPKRHPPGSEWLKRPEALYITTTRPIPAA